MNRQRLLSLILITALLLIVSGCSRKSASNSSPDSSNSSQTASSQPAPSSPPAEPQAATPPPASEPTPSFTTTPTKKAAPAVKPTPVPQRAAAPPPKPIVIPAGTVLNVRLDQPISSKTSQTGDRFQASVSSPVVVQGKTLVPTGAHASGTVTDAKDAGRFKGAASLTLALNSVAIGGKPYRIQTAPATQTSKGKGSRTAKMVGGGTAGGALIGGIAGGGKGAAIGALVGAGAGTAGAATGNADINLPVETVVSFQMTAPVTLPPAPTQGNTVPEASTEAGPPNQ